MINTPSKKFGSQYVSAASKLKSPTNNIFQQFLSQNQNIKQIEIQTGNEIAGINKPPDGLSSHLSGGGEIIKPLINKN